MFTTANGSHSVTDAGAEAAGAIGMAVVSLFTAMARVCFEHGPHDLDLLARRLEDILTIADRSMRPGWDR